MPKRLMGLCFLLMILAAPLWMLVTGRFTEALPKTDENIDIPSLETILAQRIPGVEALQRLRIGLKYISGSKEQNGVLIADNMLMMNVEPSSQDVINSNITRVIELSSRFERQVSLMLIPTASAIQQSKVPYNFAPPYDQRALIDEVYRKMSGNLTVIDVYPTLFNHQNEYIYYRTNNSPTGMGGYYIYTVAAKKLGVSQIRGLEQFDIQNIDYDFHGDLYKIAPYSAVTPDRVSLYVFSGGRRGYTMTHYKSPIDTRRYYTIYPEFQKELGSSMDVVLGGVSPIVDIQVENSQYNKQLLIFGDYTMQSYLPFLLSHYSRVTFVETAQVTTELLTKINPRDYSQILFAYSVDRFVRDEQLTELGRFAVPAAVNKG